MSEADYDRAYAIASEQTHDLKYMYYSHIVGLVGVVCAHNIPLNDDTIWGIKDAIVDEVYYGVEPEFDDYGLLQWWEQMEASWFEIKPGQMRGGIQYAGEIKCNRKPADFKEE